MSSSAPAPRRPSASSQGTVEAPAGGSATSWAQRNRVAIAGAILVVLVVVTAVSWGSGRSPTPAAPGLASPTPYTREVTITGKDGQLKKCTEHVLSDQFSAVTCGELTGQATIIVPTPVRR